MRRFGDLARAVAAGLLVFAGIMAAVAAVGALGWMADGAWLPIVVILATATVVGAAALRLFNPTGTFFLGRSAEEALSELERRGLLADTRFEVTRAFGVKDYGDEGSHYFLELADGSGILALCGQYLYAYEPIDDDPELNQPRRFPCSTFTVRRHRTQRYVVDVICSGDVIEPEVMAPGSIVRSWIRDGFSPEDGEILTGVSFDDLKRTRATSG
jgi:hypothetical protein